MANRIDSHMQNSSEVAWIKAFAAVVIVALVAMMAMGCGAPDDPPTTFAQPQPYNPGGPLPPMEVLNAYNKTDIGKNNAHLTHRWLLLDAADGDRPQCWGCFPTPKPIVVGVMSVDSVWVSPAEPATEEPLLQYWRQHAPWPLAAAPLRRHHE